MKFDEDFPRRVASARAQLGITQTQLAEMVGVVQRQIAAYENGESKPRMGSLLRLSRALGKPMAWLAQGEPLLIIERGDSEPHDEIAIIDIKDVSKWLDPAHNRDSLVKKLHKTSYILSDLSFAIVNNDPAMAFGDPDGNGFPIGSIVYFEPNIDAEDQDFVLALLPDGSAIFRQLFVGYGGPLLNPLDSRYPQEAIRKYHEDGYEPMLIPAVGCSYKLPSSRRLNE